MRRLSIEVSPEQHQRLKAIAALHGQSIKEYVLQRALPDLPGMDDLSEEEALQRLEAFLQPRLAEAERGELSTLSVEEIFAEVREAKP
jgi:predicted transcriptional regulator